MTYLVFRSRDTTFARLRSMEPETDTVHFGTFSACKFPYRIGQDKIKHFLTIAHKLPMSTVTELCEAAALLLISRLQLCI
jgi:hypothetical protein